MPLLAGCGRRHAEYAEPAGRREQAIALLERLATDGIENELDTASAGDRARPRLEILGAVIDDMRAADLTQLVVLAGRCRADDRRTDMPSDLRRRDPDAAAGRMDEDALAALEAAHDDYELPGGEVVHRQRRGFHRRQSRRPRKHLV